MVLREAPRDRMPQRWREHYGTTSQNIVGEADRRLRRWAWSSVRPPVSTATMEQKRFTGLFVLDRACQ